ncbi:MAG TPA: protoporphyrinogen oxidase [Polyangiaceae bacterium]|nr:protoporphyrinogen oxidase [Polyangiaceae bacterium]
MAPVIAIVGGGITGLSAAYFLQRSRPDARIVLYESRARLGGNIHTEREQGFLFDAGPDSFLRAKPWALELCKELGLEGELTGTRPEGRAVFLAHSGSLERMPEGLVLGVPTRVRPILSARSMSLPGKLRMLCELLLPENFGRRAKGPHSADESLATFIGRRFGTEAATALGTPLLAGIYAGDAQELSIQATFPHLPELEARYGSVIRGLIQAQLEPKERVAAATLQARLQEARAWLKKPAPTAAAASPFVSLRGGMGRLIAALRARLAPGTLRLGVTVDALERSPEKRGWSLAAADERIAVDAVLVATPSRVAAQILPQGALASELATIRYASTATVFLGVDTQNLRRPLEGSGFIVPPGEGGLLAGTWVSSKWDGRAPPGTALVRAFLGGVQSDIDVSRESDQALLEIARFELSRLMGPLGQARVTRVYRHILASPQPTIGHGARLARIKQQLAALPGLHLAGAAYDGVSISDCVRQARAAVDGIVASL